MENLPATPKTLKYVSDEIEHLSLFFSATESQLAETYESSTWTTQMSKSHFEENKFHLSIAMIESNARMEYLRRLQGYLSQTYRDTYQSGAMLYGCVLLKDITAAKRHIERAKSWTTAVAEGRAMTIGLSRDVPQKDLTESDKVPLAEGMEQALNMEAAAEAHLNELIEIVKEYISFAEVRMGMRRDSSGNLFGFLPDWEVNPPF